MTVYAIHALETNFVKVGYTKKMDANKRLLEVQTYCPHRLEVFALRVGAPPVLENMVHRTIEAFHVRGEWFSLNNEERERLVELFAKLPDYRVTLEQEIMRDLGLSASAVREYFEVDPWVKK